MTDVVTLDQVRAHLRMPITYTADDMMLSTVFIKAANDVIKRECGDIIPKQFEEYYDGGDFAIYLRNTPLLSVEFIEEGWGYTNYVLNYVQVNTILPNEADIDPIFAYSIDIPGQGKISRRYGGNVPAPFVRGESNIHIVYTAGKEAIPGNVTLASLELIAHWYQGSQQRQVGNFTEGYDATDNDFTRSEGTTGINAGVPYRILELLKPNRRAPIIG